MIKLSALCPVLFGQTYNGIGIHREYIQRFSVGDVIYIQLIGDAGQHPTIELRDARTDEVVGDVEVTEHEMMSSGAVYEAILRPESGLYFVIVSIDGQSLKSGTVEVTDNERELKHLAVIDYGFSSNGNLFDTRFVDKDKSYLFRLRVEGGFLCDSDTLGLDNEFFRNQLQHPEQLYQYPYVKRKLIMGNAVGVPLWMGTLLNNLLCCEKVMIDGVEYVRSESSVPERVKIGSERYPLFQFVTVLERDIESVNCDIFNIPILRMIDDDLFRLIANGGWRRL